MGGKLKSCCENPATGWFRDGYCRTDENDLGSHTVCALVTNRFLKFSKEIGIGFLAIIGILMSFFSYNYLKGINLFDSNRNFKINYSKVDGLSTSDPVTLNGFKIGRVHKINFNPNNTKELIVDIIIENDVNFSNTSIAELYETGLIGGKAIAIIPDYKNDSPRRLNQVQDN